LSQSDRPCVGIATPLLARLRDRSLIDAVMVLGGDRLSTVPGNATFAVTDPATSGIVATLPDCGVAEMRQAIELAHAAQPGWAARSAKERAAVLRRIYDLIIEHADDLATILTMEMGKPLAEARGEILYGASYFEWFAEEAKRAYGDIIPGHEADKRIQVLRMPVGVVGAITPWNFPNAMIARKIAPALAAGCAIVCKPAAQTPLSAIAIGLLAERAGLPNGLLSILPGTDSSAVGQELCANPKVRKITFTGSTEVGRVLMRQCADQVKKMSLELGGNAPFIVFDDADLDKAVEGAMAAKFRNAGQTCVCANRIYVQAGIYDLFAQELTAAVGALTLGNGFDAGVTAGPLIEENSMVKVEEHIADALALGGELTIGGERSALGPLFFTPTVIKNATREMKVAREETFGPLAPLFRFETVQDVIAQANDTEFGLAAYFYTRDVTRVWQVAEALEYGMVGVNTGKISTEVAPFGGVKQSGVGREGSRYGMDEYLERKYVCIEV
jgi:succinate-semialdehyde dehydrogenase/glutarate-semialdehyde dehydrogenase